LAATRARLHIDIESQEVLSQTALSRHPERSEGSSLELRKTWLLLPGQILRSTSGWRRLLL